MRYTRLFGALGLAVAFGQAAPAWGEEWLAYAGSHNGAESAADADILAAMRALEEVGAILGDPKTLTTNDIDSLLEAAAAPAKSTPPAAKAQAPAAAGPAQAPPAASAGRPPVTPAQTPTAALSQSDTKVVQKPATAETQKPTAEVASASQSNTKPVVSATTAESAKPTAETPSGASLAKTTSNKQTGTAAPDPSSAPQTLAMAYISAIYQHNGVDLKKASPKRMMPSIGELYQYAFSQKLVYQNTRPAIGDLAFFHNTTDRNRDGLWNDWHTLVGIVEAIDADETISVLVYEGNEIRRIHLNLKFPELHKGRKGQILNTQIRANEGSYKGIASKLFGGFANLLGDATSVTVIDNWKPGMEIQKGK
ncbi:MAG: hypothetical protein FWC40_05695 [Proteobacteria bacterium]|nr:hypothetical protein [Pseudomonadota bacterium]